MEGSHKLTVNNLYRELATVSKPIQFGTLLNIPQATLDTIAADNHLNLDGQRMDVFRYMAENSRVNVITWSSIASALDTLGQGDLAGTIRIKYGVPTSSEPGTQGQPLPEPRQDNSTKTRPILPRNKILGFNWIFLIMMTLAGILVTWSFQGYMDKSPSEDHSRDTYTRHKITNLNELYKSVDSIPGDWESVCVNLRVPEGVLSELQSSPSSGVSKMRGCLRAYYDSGEALWEEVVLAVASAPIYNKRLAKKIADRHRVDFESLVTIND